MNIQRAYLGLSLFEALYHFLGSIGVKTGVRFGVSFELLPPIYNIKFTICTYRNKRDPEESFEVPAVTGPVGFEPTNAAVKVLCLTAWRRPWMLKYSLIIIL